MKTTCLDIPRFVFEYGNYLKHDLTVEGKETIDKWIYLVSHGFINVDETMRKLAETAHDKQYWLSEL